MWYRYAKSRIDWDLVIEMIRSGERIPSIARHIGVSPNHLRREVVKRFSREDSPDYNPEMMRQVDENNSSMSNRIDWSLVRQMVNDGRTASEISSELGVSLSYLLKMMKAKYGDPDNGDFDQSLLDKVRSNRDKVRRAPRRVPEDTVSPADLDILNNNMASPPAPNYNLQMAVSKYLRKI